MKLADGGRPNGLVMWLGHYQVYFMVVFLLLAALRQVPGASWPAEVAWYAASAAWVPAFIANMTAHRRRLCERCISGVPVLAPQGAVTRWRRALWLTHRPRVLVGAVAPVLAVAVAGFAGVAVPVALGGAGAAWLMCVLAASNYAGYQHQRLQLWCPWCPRDDGGDGEAVEPVPETPLARR